MSYDFTQVTTVGNWEVKIDPARNFGCFERETDGECGGLWFEATSVDGRLGLVDYDGVFELSEQVKAAIRSFGHIVGEGF